MKDALVSVLAVVIVVGSTLYWLANPTWCITFLCR